MMADLLGGGRVVVLRGAGLKGRQKLFENDMFFSKEFGGLRKDYRS